MEIVKNIAHKLLLCLFRTFFEATENIWWLTASCVAHHLLNAGII